MFARGSLQSEMATTLSWICLVVCLAGALADPFHNGFVAKWSPIPGDREAYYTIPRTQAEAEAGTLDNIWEEVDTGSGNPFTIFCQPDNERFCPIYDNNGFVAGMQIGIPAEAIVNSSVVYPFDDNMLYSKVMRFGRDTYVGTAFFINPSVLAAGGRSDLNEGTLVELWLQNGPSYTDVTQIPLNPDQLLTDTDFTLQNCVPSMGIHYYYDIRSTLPCSSFDPWFMLYKDTNITGVGFQSFGRFDRRSDPNQRYYNEDVPLDAVLFVLNDPPECISTWVPEYALVSLHVYFVQAPALVNTCS